MAFIGEAAFPAINQATRQPTGLVPTAPAPVQPPQGTPGEDVASSGGQTDRAATPYKTTSPGPYAWLLAWGVILAVLTLINHTRIGHAAIYYVLLLLLFFVIVSNYRFVQTSLAPFQTLGQGKQGSS